MVPEVSGEHSKLIYHAYKFFNDKIDLECIICLKFMKRLANDTYNIKKQCVNTIKMFSLMFIA